MNVETERIAPADVSDEQSIHQDKEPDSESKMKTTIFDAQNEEMTDSLPVPKRNIRRFSDGLKVTATGALETGRDGIKKAASGLSSGIKTVTNKIPLPKSPKALRRRSWHAYDELEEHIFEKEPDDDKKESKKGNVKKDKVEASKEKTKKDKNKGKKNGKNGVTTEAKIDLCPDEAANKCDELGDKAPDAKEEAPVYFESLESVELISKVTINVHETN